MGKNNKRNIEIDCTCLDLFEESTKVYRFSDCEIIKKCVKDGTLKESDSICIYGKEGCGKTLLLTELLVDLSAVNELRGMNCKVAFLDCDLSFNYKNYEDMISKKFEKYINNNTVDIYGKYEKNQLKNELLEQSFSNVYYIPIFNPGHLLVILNSKLCNEDKFVEYTINLSMNETNIDPGNNMY